MLPGAILVQPAAGWSARAWEALLPGAHAVLLLAEDAEFVLREGRGAGFELRDTVLVIHTGPTIHFAFVIRKPVEESTIVAQLLATGTGAIHIGACRIQGPASIGGGSRSTALGIMNDDGWKPKTQAIDRSMAAGRWPTNLVFVHGTECRKVGTKGVRGSNVPGTDRGSAFGLLNDDAWKAKERKPTTYTDEDGLETVTAWECEFGCPVAALDSQSGVRASTLTGRADATTTHDNPGNNGGASWFGGGNSSVYADSGGASRFYVQVDSSLALIDWFRRLILPEGSSLYEEL